MGSNPTPGMCSDPPGRVAESLPEHVPNRPPLRRAPPRSTFNEDPLPSGRSLCGVTHWDDEDDWVGEPPEGRHTRERADPTFWLRRPLLSFVGAAILSVALIVLLIVLLA